MKAKLGTLTIWIVVMYLVVQCWIFIYNLENGTSTDSSNVGPKERTNKLQFLFKPKARLPEKTCVIPDNWLYPLCKYKLEWMRYYWNSNRECYLNRHGIHPDDDCSLLIFFSEVERWCPSLPWRKHLYPPSPAHTEKNKNKKLKTRDSLEELMHKMSDHKYHWMKERITRLWPDWREAAKILEREKPAFRNRQVKDIFAYMGAFASHSDWLERAYTGLPLGEMLQWSDLIASLYILGHNVTISAERQTMNRLLDANPNDTACAKRLSQKPFDLIFTDYIGTSYIFLDMGGTSSHYRCSYRILDSFGTDAEFNYAEYALRDQRSHRGGWGNRDVHLQQIMTMFPHSPDNLFLGFVVDKAVITDKEWVDESSKTHKPIGLLYAKKPEYLKDRRQYIDVLSKYLEVHATITNHTESSSKNVTDLVPDYVINHGIVTGSNYQSLLRRAKVFIGLGFPYEGTAPLEAISQGCVFINPKFDPPHSRENTEFFKFKPTNRKVTSQHPYMETFIGKPHVYTIDVNNVELVESTIKEIISLEVTPYLPYEWTPKGMLERLSSFIEYLDFCEQGKQWPPLKEMQLVLGTKGNSCKDACSAKDFLCEPSYFNFINSVEHFKRLGVICEKQIKEESLHAPSYDPADQLCTLQTMPFLFSCVAEEPVRMRLCPCRDYQPQQVAFCKNCD